MAKLRIKTAGLAAAVTLLAYPAHASLLPSAASSIDYFELSPEQLLNAEVVSVTKTKQKVSQSAAAVYVLSNEQIVRSGATSIPEALRLVPGVHVARIDSSSWAIGIRGFNAALSNKLLVLMDGRVLYNPLFSGVYWDVQDTILEDIDRIEVIRGPGATLWGANAVNGVINIITKRAEETQGGFAKLGFGTHENALTSLRYGGELAEDKGHYRVYGKMFDREAQRAPGGGEAWDEWQAYRGGFRMDMNDTLRADDFTFQGDVYRSDSGHVTNDYTFTAAGVDQETKRAEGANILGNWQKTMSDDSKVTLISYLDYTKRDERILTDERWAFDVDLQYDFASMDAHDWTIGARYRFTTDNLEGNQAVSFDPASRADHLFSAYMQDKITLSPEKWYLTLGSKFEVNDYTGFEIQPNARLQWHPSDDKTVWASASRAVRTPSRLEHDLNITTNVIPSTTPPLQVLLQGNRNFESEELYAYELGYRQQINEDLSMDLATFYNDYDNLYAISVQSPFFMPADSFGPARTVVPLLATNNMTGETYGAELFMDWRVKENWKLAASYSLLDIQLHSSGTSFNGNSISVEDEEDQSPHHMFTVQSMWDVRDNLTFDTYLYYMDSLADYQIDDYLRLDMRLGWKINDNLHLNLIGQNLLDNAHREYDDVGATEIERTFFARVIWKF